ncbi:hypothetical protein K432DRAFT_398289 [Lepidopterella palustris CBS 459.81]|uniref:Uncharacterized protein n=1 Tax=Lepidopterella palustris CBS 459.81 TaxID=1314670 RepID=A0A8E2J9F6_9PEZI|nr:hypothetical protein K432DRAFT_398289 [Lepidopterella palustris CBS 459.81]
MSSKSSVEMNPVHISGIREVARALLSHDGFKSLCTAAVSNVAPRKSRVHIRGFLKNYGQQLDREASSQLQHQAARFVQEVAGRLADEIRWSITGFDEVNEPADTGVEKQNLEKWLSNVENGISQVIPKSDDPDQLIDDGDESDDEPDITAAFPSIDAVREFLLSSNAFATLNQALDRWMNVNKRPTTKERAVAIPEIGQNIDLEHAINERTLADTPAFAACDLPEKSISNSSRIEQQSLSQSRSQSVKTLISSLLDFWGVSFFLYDLLELLVPPVPIGFERVRWRCSCNTVLWGDFPVDDSDALNNLKQDLCRNKSFVVNSRRDSHTKKTPASQRPYGLPTDQTSASVRATNFSNSSSQTATAREGAAGSTSSGRFSPVTELNAPSNEIGTHLVSLTEVTVDKHESTYFEVCTNIGNYAVGHFEIDISEVCTDGELFEKIWDTYNQSRGFGIRRLFLRPRDVHFVMFSISNRRAAQYSAGIHKKPEEYPPDEEIQQQRYHYFSPKIVMPGHVFIHFLHRARWNVWGEHADDTWLKRLPKKLNESILAAQAANANSDLVFGWGVHILDGPNHAVLGLFLAFGLMITFVISCLIVGIAKTQEQAFGVGQYLVAIVVALMSAMYFKLQDQ